MIARIKALSVFICALNDVSGITLGTSDLRVLLLFYRLNMMTFRKICTADKHTVAAFFNGHCTAAVWTHRTGDFF